MRRGLQWNVVVVMISVTFVLASGCQKAAPPAPLANVVVIKCETLPETPDHPTWDTVPECVVQLIAQDLVEPRLLKLSTPEIRVRAVSDGNRMAFRMTWADATKDDLPGPTQFVDACAVQLPSVIEATVPAPQMGETGRPVDIVFWNAAWQATIDGRGDTIHDLQHRAAVDHYPFEAASLSPGSPTQQEMATRYAPARAVGNTMAGPRKTPIQDLIATGPGTLAPVAEGRSTGAGCRTTSGWSVVIVRDVPKGLIPRGSSQVAFAVWEGSHAEIGARKMRTAWIPLMFETKQ